MLNLLVMCALLRFAANEPAADLPVILQLQNMPKTVQANPVSHLMARGDYRQAVDEAWDEGGDAAEDLRVFDLFWNTIDAQFACFQDLDTDWDAFRALYRDEVAQGVSRGRLAFILSRMAIDLRESHTSVLDFTVFLTQVVKDTPVLRLLISGTTPFGAAVTSQPDGSGLVYRADPNHPMQLQPGDVLLGYDGVPWSELWPVLLDAGLPIYAVWGSAPRAFEHGMAASIGVNWHLFEVLDVRRRNGAVDHLPTALMSNYTPPLLFRNDQLAVGGMTPLTWEESMQGAPNVRWGVLDDSDIGYIYVYAWSGDVDVLFDQAVTELTLDQDLSGLIIDFRTNFGGNLFLSNPALAKLFQGSTPTIGFARRDPAHPEDRLAMVASDAPEVYTIEGGTSGYDKPIAVLVGPGAVSSGDQVAYRMSFHPQARLFGLTTNGAFNAPADLDLGEGWYARLAVADAYAVTDPQHFLTHDPLMVDVPVWLTPEDVAQGADTVAEAAIAWIQAENADCENPEQWLTHITQTGGFFTSSVAITNHSETDAQVVFQLYEINGESLPATSLSVAAGSTLTESTETLFNQPSLSHLAFCAPEGVVVSVGYRAASGIGATAWVGSEMAASMVHATYPAEWDYASDGLAVLNTSDTATPVTVDLLDANGAVLDSHILSESLAPKAKALLVANSVFEVPASLIRVNAVEPVQVLFLKITHVELGPTYLYKGQTVQ